MPRKIRVSTVCMRGRLGPTVEKNREHVLELLDLACAENPDIVCLPENFATAGVSLPVEKKAEAVPGPTTDACAKRAREHRSYVVCPLTNKRDGRFFNSAVIVDRDGQIAGVYDKVHPVTTTADFTVVEEGMTPGREAGVFELDFGRVGCQICFDIGFPETWGELARRGAELVFWPSAYDGGFPLRVYACYHEYYVVSSVRTDRSRIVNPFGEVLEMTGRRMPMVSRVIDLDYVICHTDFHTTVPQELVRAHGRDITVRVCNEEGRFIAESNGEDLPLSKLVEEFGMEAAERYHARHWSVYEALLNGKKPEPQLTPYKDRPQWG